MEQTCQFCRFWIAYDSPADTAGSGECIRPAFDGCQMRLRGNLGPAIKGTVLVTDFDFFCKHWQQVIKEL